MPSDNIFQRVKTAADGAWSDVIIRASGCDPELLNGKQHPCPKCSGKTRFRFTDRAGSGSSVCTQCDNTADGIGTLARILGDESGNGQHKAALLVAEQFGIETNGKPKRRRQDDPVGEYARQKNTTAEALRDFGAMASGNTLSIPMFDEAGNRCGSYEAAPYEYATKDKYASGSKHGLFLPLSDSSDGPRMPQQGETWFLVEGVKDASKLHSMEFLAAGMPTSQLASQLATAFRGVNVVSVPDLDDAATNGLTKTAANLRGVAASYLVVRLPMEYRATKGPDVRDAVLQIGEQATRAFIDDQQNWQTPEQYLAAVQPGETEDDEPEPIRLWADSRMTSKELAEADMCREYLIEGILVAGQPMVIGGPAKALKTSLLIDLVCSLATGTPFMGKFDCPRACRVGIMSGESGGSKIRSTAMRVLEKRGLHLRGEENISWYFDVPRVGVEPDMLALRQEIEERGLEVITIDPAYLALLNGVFAKTNSANVFEMGQVLMRLTNIGQETGCTIIIAHHFNKAAEQTRGSETSLPDLNDLSQSGFREWARQWILLKRRERFVAGSGVHKLWFVAGGSEGHCWEFAIDIYDQQTWQVEVRPVQEVRTAATEEAERLNKHNAAEREEKKRAGYCEQIVAVLNKQGVPLTKTKIGQAAKLNPTNTKNAMDHLLEQGQVIESPVKVGGRSYVKYQVPEQQTTTGLSVAPDNEDSQGNDTQKQQTTNKPL